MKAAFAPIPPETESGAGVVAFPINTDESKSDERIVFPVPFANNVKLSSDRVEIVAAAPPPMLRVVESIANVAAASIVARTPAFIVVRPDAESVVSDAAIVRVLFPASSVRVLAPPDIIDPTPVNVRESMSRIVPSTDTLPASALSSIVIDPVPAATSNSEKLIAVAPPLIDVRDVPLRVVVLLRLIVSELRPRIDPAAPLRGDILMFPVVAPPSVRVLFRSDWIVELAAFKLNPLLLVVADRVAVGAPEAIPVTAN